MECRDQCRHKRQGHRHAAGMQTGCLLERQGAMQVCRKATQGSLLVQEQGACRHVKFVHRRTAVCGVGGMQEGTELLIPREARRRPEGVGTRRTAGQANGKTS